MVTSRTLVGGYLRSKWALVEMLFGGANFRKMVSAISDILSLGVQFLLQNCPSILAGISFLLLAAG